jgi:DNA-binding NarL/FixJ family response regulator
MISVMIVDDEIQAIEYLESLIDWERHGYKIVSKTTDGASAVAIFDELSPDVVLAVFGNLGVDIRASQRDTFGCVWLRLRRYPCINTEHT